LFLVSSTSGQMTVNTGGTLAGIGAVGGVASVHAGATVSPGTNGTIGTLTFNNNLTLAGTAAMDISKNGATLAADQLACAGNLTLGGALVVNDLGPGTLA